MDRAAGNTRLLAEELAVSEDPHADLARVRILLKGLIAECKFWQATALLPRSCHYRYLVSGAYFCAKISFKWLFFSGMLCTS